MKSSQFAADGNGGLQVMWEDGERVFCRGWRQSAHEEQRAVLIVLPAAERPSLASLDRLAHEYELKDELDGAWAARPLELVREDGRTMLVLEDSGGEPLARLLGAAHGGRRLLAPRDRHRRGPGQGPPARPRPQGPEARPYPGELRRRTGAAHRLRHRLAACRANDRRSSRPRPSPARWPIWRPNRPDG